MPQSIVRFLRVYASVVMLLVAGVLAIGTEPAVARADFGNVQASSTHVVPKRAMRIVSFDRNWQDAKFSFAATVAHAQPGALPRPATRIGSAGARTCEQKTLLVRHQS